MSLSKSQDDAVAKANVHVLYPAPSGAGMALRVSNIRQIESSFGWEAARAILRKIKRVLDQQFDIFDVDETDFGVFSFFLPASNFTMLGIGSQCVEDGLSQAFQAILVTAFLRDDSVGALPVVQVAVAVAGESAPLGSRTPRLLAIVRRAIRASELSADVREVNAEAKRRYREQTSLASQYLNSLLSSEGQELAGSICRANGQVLLYNSLLLSVVTEDGSSCPLTDGYDAVVSMGLVRAVDEMRVMRAIRSLVADPSLAIGVQVSAASAVMDYWWSTILAELDENPSAAGRLYVELQPPIESFARPRLLEFCKEMRFRGVLIVLDRFGAGGSSLRDILVLQPDYVKIEASFLWRAREGEESFQTLRHLIGLASSLKAPAIVSGVDSEALAKAATDAGAIFQCGDFISPPFKLRHSQSI